MKSTRICLIAAVASMLWSPAVLRAQQVVRISDGIDLANVTTAGNLEVVGDFTSNNTAAGANLLPIAAGIATAAAPSYTEGRIVGLSTNLAGELRVTGASGSGDTELAAAVLLANNIALPTVPIVGAANLCYDGTNLDLCLSSLVTEVTEDVAETAGAVGYSMFSVRRDTPASSAGATGRNATLNTDASGYLYATLRSALIDDGAFTPATFYVNASGYFADETSPDSVDEGDLGAARMSLDRILYQRPGGALVHYRTSTGATEDEHEIKATPGTLYSALITNTNAAARYIRCYNLTAANTTPGTSTVFWGAAIPGNTAAAGFVYPFPAGLTFDTALTCSWTTGLADTDAVEVAANEIKATYTYR